MSTYIFILGKTPELSIAELYARYPKTEFQFIGDGFIVLDTDIEIDQSEFDKLGGSVKCAKVVSESAKGNLIQNLSDLLFTHYKGTKLDYGLSIYEYPEKQLRTILLELKKELRKGDIKSRFINNQFTNITAAQYKSIKNKGVEIVVAKISNTFQIAEVVGVQDIDAYGKRDYGKPFRDMRMGMLPPKLAQILVNLAGAKGTIWDPFCGSGTVTMEGVLIGHDMIGTDINPLYIEGARKNIEWLKREFGVKKSADLFVHDATKTFKEKFDAIVFEGDLGLPHNQYIKPELLQKIIDKLDNLYISFFENLKRMKCDRPVVCALPFFRMRDGYEKDMKKTIEQIEKMGFKRIPLLPDTIQGKDKFKLKYAREDQAVGRAIYKFQYIL